MELEVGLCGEDRTGERTRDEHDQLRAEPHLVDLLDDQLWPHLAVEDTAHGLPGEQGKVAKVTGEGENEVSDVAGRRHGEKTG